MGMWRRTLFFALIIIITFGMIFAYIDKEKSRKELENRFWNEINEVESQINRITNESKTKNIDRNTAQQKLQLQDQYLENLKKDIQNQPEKILPKTKNDLLIKIDETRKGIEKNREIVSGKETISDLTPIYDLTMAKANFKADIAALINNEGFFADFQKKEAILLNLKNKSFRTINLNANSGDKLLTAHNMNSFYQVNTESDSDRSKILDVYKLSDNQIDKKADQTFWPEESNGNSRAILAGENNLYFLQDNPDKIWRQKIEPKNEADKIIKNWWEKNDEQSNIDQPNLALVSDIAIDNSIWIAQNDGQIFKMTSGMVTKWKPKDLNEPISGPIRIDTDYQNDEGLLFVLSPTLGKVLILNKKTGEMEREISSPVFVDAVDIFANVEENKFYIAKNDKIFELLIQSEN